MIQKRAVSSRFGAHHLLASFRGVITRRDVFGATSTFFLHAKSAKNNFIIDSYSLQPAVNRRIWPTFPNFAQCSLWNVFQTFALNGSYCFGLFPDADRVFTFYLQSSFLSYYIYCTFGKQFKAVVFGIFSANFCIKTPLKIPWICLKHKMHLKCTPPAYGNFRF